ncbi:chloramphenicol phosphotransferase CPT family protein [Nocardia cyriacigeorgica]|jgi:hypothetical protein|nr:chloramphenicol phosphotransferase CPT family protein [Nocardia cyriacigeorgica]
MPSADRPPRVILLNGTSSAGKTTVARAIQDESGVPFVYWGIDTLFGLVPPNWGGGRDGPLSRDGSGMTAPATTPTATRSSSSGTATWDAACCIRRARPPPPSPRAVTTW